MDKEKQTTGEELIENYLKAREETTAAEMELWNYCLQKAKNSKPEDWKSTETEKPPYGKAVISLLGDGDIDKDEISIVALFKEGDTELCWYNILEDWIYAYENTDWLPLDKEA